MRIVGRKPKENKITLRIENPEDLWHLDHLVEPGDVVISRTLRKVVIKSGDEVRHGERKPMVLAVKAEKIEFHNDSGILRITGPIEETAGEAQKGSYHTLAIEEGSVLTIRKEWKKHHLDRISKSRVKKRDLLVCVLDREHCDVALLKESGIEMKAGIENHDKENMNDYYKEIEGFIENQKYEKIIVAGPGFERENFLRYLKTKRSGLEKDVILEHASSVGINGVQEVIKKSANRILRESRISRETEIIQELMTRISREGLAVYGKKEVENAMELGALERLFVSDRKVRDYEGLMERFEKMKGEVVIIGSDHESGEQFLHLGGIAGFLRFKTAY